MRQMAEFVAVLACSLFTGASVYINLVEHPAGMECGVEIAATEFAPSYRRATIMQASSAALGLLSSIAACLAGATLWWLVGGAVLGSIVTFTLFVILPTNKLLLSPTLDKRSVEAERLLARTGCTPCAVCSAEWRCSFSCAWRSSISLCEIVLTEFCLLRRACFGSFRSHALPCHADLRT